MTSPAAIELLPLVRFLDNPSTAKIWRLRIWALVIVDPACTVRLSACSSEALFCRAVLPDPQVLH
eukprot:2574693-Amphidinium_carterae.1